ncbi:MAG TPA: N-acetylglucosamine-6-phosphate deacetylase [Usitatibacter sp.]|nr:N-acetylglucosamine-6-phosphate deacetylase [Usitatibacter sp.]
MRALLNARVLLDGRLVEGRAVLVQDDRIAAVVEPSDARCRGAQRHDLAGALLLPGFIDVQVNGGGGILFNDAPTVESIRAIGEAHRRFGTTAFLPTLISDDIPVIRRAIAAVRSAIEQRVPGVIGIHIEGPFINAERRGAHDAAKVRALDEAGVQALMESSGGSTLVTLAPEATTPETIRRLAGAGLLVCAGHTNATFEQLRAAFAAGVRGVTHLFNAMSPLGSREPGAVGAALLDPECWCGIIVDGRHVHPAALQLALRAKRLDRFMLVTDAMPCVGAAQGSFLLQGRRIQVRDGVCVDDGGVLSGSAIDMATAVRNAMDLLGLPLEQAVAMASAHPARFLGLEGERGRIAPGCRADLVVADERMNVKQAWIGGNPPAGVFL